MSKNEGLTMNQLAEINAQHVTTIAALEAKCAALAAEVQAVRWACGQVYVKGYNHGHLNTVDGLDYASEAELVERGGEVLADFTDPDHCGVAADAILAEVRAQGGADALERFAEFNLKSIDNTASEYTEHLTETARAARGFAGQLRKGASA